MQRSFVLKIIKAYWTVSLNSALLLARLLPLNLRIQEAARIYEILKKDIRNIVGDRDVKRQVPYEETFTPVKLEESEFSCLGDGAQMIPEDSQTVQIFTDGSNIGGKVGAGLSIWKGAAETRTQKLKLGHFCTVCQTIILALFEASKKARKNSVRGYKIYNDSRSALETINRGDSLHALALY